MSAGKRMVVSGMITRGNDLLLQYQHGLVVLSATWCCHKENHAAFSFSTKLSENAEKTIIEYIKEIIFKKY